VLEERFQYSYYMHADDDSYVRLDLVLQLLVGVTPIQLAAECLLQVPSGPPSQMRTLPFIMLLYPTFLHCVCILFG